MDARKVWRRHALNVSESPLMPHDAPQTSVLVVDDDPATLRLVAKFLENAAYDVVPTSSANEAWEVLCTRGADLVITDWLMPDISGVELCSRIRAHPELGFFYVVMLTSETSRGKLVEALDAGADDFVTKPFHRDELLARVRVGARIVRMHGELERRNRENYESRVQLAVLNKRLKSQAYTDELTGLFNRREAFRRLAVSWTGAATMQTPLSCILLDVDFFKRVNDAHGHEAGDVVLATVSRILKQTCRQQDVVARVGGEEFLVLCPRTTSTQAEMLAERVRNAVRNAVIPVAGERLSVTLSLGVTERAAHMQTPEDMIRTADQALYAAKNSGRDQVRVGVHVGDGVTLADDQGILLD